MGDGNIVSLGRTHFPRNPAVERSEDVVYLYATVGIEARVVVNNGIDGRHNGADYP